MKLTGKCKQDFEVWINDQTFPQVKGEETEVDQLPVSMQFGIIQEFADSVGYRIEAASDTLLDIDSPLFVCKITTVKLEDVSYYPFKRYKYKDIYSCGGFNPRKEAQQAAIEKFNEIYNKP